MGAKTLKKKKKKKKAYLVLALGTNSDLGVRDSNINFITEQAVLKDRAYI